MKTALMTIVLICCARSLVCHAQVKSTAPRQDNTTAQEVTTALEGAYGVHPGQRRNHTKGMCAAGNFVGEPAALMFSRSVLFSGSSVPVVARFSLAGGDPNASDKEKSPRGLALEFRLPDGSLQHMTMINTPMFFAAMPKTFLDKMLALKIDPKTGKPDPAAFKAFASSHPDNTGQATFLSENNPPVSYANGAYFGIHTFKFINSDDKVTMVKWRFEPQDGGKLLSDAELKTWPNDFLQPALIERTQRGPVRWDMIITVGEPGDAEDNPTILWPTNRKELKVGTLTITSAMDQKGAACERINYDPLVMADGIAPTNDPVLLFRSPSYASSFNLRQQGK